MNEKCLKLEIILIPAQGLELYVKVPGVAAGVPQPSSGDPVVIMILLGKSGRKKCCMECFYRSNPIDENGVLLKGYRQKMYREWLE